MIDEIPSEPGDDPLPFAGEADLSALPWSHIVVQFREDADRSLELVPNLAVVGLDDPRLPVEVPTGPGSCVLALGQGAMRAAGELRGVGVEQVFGRQLPPGCQFLSQFLEERAAAVEYFGGGDHLREVLEAWNGGAHLLEVSPSLHPDLQRPLPTLQVFSLSDMAAIERRAEIVSELILDDSLNVLIAPPKSFKTVIGDNLCIAVADDTSWLGRKVKKPGLVIDWALEGLAGKPDRYRAQIGLRRFNDPKDPIHRRLFLLREMPDITNTSGQDMVLRTIDKLTKDMGERLSLLKIDTLARGMSRCGRDENSTKDMGAFVAGLDRIRAEYPCAQEVVHHTGKNGIVERGSTALAGAADLLMFCKKEAKLTAKVWVRDARDIEEGDGWTVTFAPTVVGTKDDGTEATSVRIDAVHVSSPPVGPTLGPGAASEVSVLHALEPAGERRLTREELCEATGLSASAIDATYHRLVSKSDISRAKAGKAWVYFRTNCRATVGQLPGGSDGRQLPREHLGAPQLAGVTAPSLEGPHPTVAGRQVGQDDGIPEQPRKRRRRTEGGGA